MIYLCIIPFALGLICYGYAFWIISKREEINKSGNSISAASFAKIMFYIMPVNFFMFGGMIVFFNTLFLSLSDMSAADSTINLFSIVFSVISVITFPVIIMFFRFGAKFENRYVTVYPLLGKSKKVSLEDVELKKNAGINYAPHSFTLKYGQNTSMNFTSICQGFAQIERLYNEKFANKTGFTE